MNAFFKFAIVAIIVVSLYSVFGDAFGLGESIAACDYYQDMAEVAKAIN